MSSHGTPQGGATRVEVAPVGAASSAGSKPAITLMTAPQGSDDQSSESSVIRIERMLRAVFPNEEKVAKWERTAASPGWRFAKGQDGKLRRVPVRELAEPELAKARADRDDNIAELHHTIDYALNTEAYEDVTCPDCKPWHMSVEPLVFIREAATSEPPPGSTSVCKTCKGRGLVRQLKDDETSKATHKRITYFKGVVETTSLCAKVRAGSSDANDAYQKLEKQNERLLSKLGNEAQTSMEGADALQGVRQGIVDAAMRFDPTRPECANFGTVAYNWAYRNSRHRQPGQKRAGVYAPSVDGMVIDEGSSPSDLIASTNGAFGSYSPESDDSSILVIDMREQIAGLPEDQRAVVTALLGGDNVAGAARTLGMRRAAVKRLRDTAFARLRNNLSDYVDVVRD